MTEANEWPQNQLGLPEIWNGLWEYQSELLNTSDSEHSQKKRLFVRK